MAIGTTAAILGGAALGVGGSVLSANATKSAARDQSRAITEGSEAAIAEQRRQFDRSMELLQPRIQAGDMALQEMSDLMGLGSIGVSPSGSAAANDRIGGGQASFDPYSGYVDQHRDLAQAYARLTPQEKSYIRSQGFNPDSKAGYGRFHYETMGRNEGRRLPSAPQSAPAATPTPTPANDQIGAGAQQPQTREERKEAALDRFEASPGYRFRLQEGIDALDMSAARRGALLSGREIKAVQEFGEGLASREYGAHYDRLSGIAGSGQQATGTAVNVNTGTGDRISDTISSAAEGRASVYGAIGNSQANMWDQIGQSVGYAVGAFA